MAKYKIVNDILSKTVNEEEVIVDLNTGTYFGLNPTGSVIWNHLKKGSDTKTILQDLMEQFDADETELARDLQEFISHLQSQNMLNEL